MRHVLSVLVVILIACSSVPYSLQVDLSPMTNQTAEGQTREPDAAAFGPCEDGESDEGLLISTVWGLHQTFFLGSARPDLIGLACCPSPLPHPPQARLAA